MNDQHTATPTHALVSAVAAEDCSRIGVAIVLRDRHRDTIYSTSYSTMQAVSVEAVTYQAISKALRNARELGSYNMTVYCDVAAVVTQLSGQEEVPATLLAPSLETRAVMNRFRRVQVKLAQSGVHFIAHKLAAGASGDDGDEKSLQQSLRLHFDAV
jgi:ribonuclease HI